MGLHLLHIGIHADDLERSVRFYEPLRFTNTAASIGPERVATLGPKRYRCHMAIRVECYAGYRGEQEPLAFWLGERRVAVRAVVDRWLAPTQRWFRVEADDGNVYVLRQDETSGHWEIAAFRRTAG